MHTRIAIPCSGGAQVDPGAAQVDAQDARVAPEGAQVDPRSAQVDPELAKFTLELPTWTLELPNRFVKVARIVEYRSAPTQAAREQVHKGKGVGFLRVL